MALEAVVFPKDHFGYGAKDIYNILGGNLSYDFGQENQQEKLSSDFLENHQDNFIYDGWINSLSCNTMMEVPKINELAHIHASNGSSCKASNSGQLDSTSPSVTSNARAKRRRIKIRKNQEEIENQRMTHIAVERNRRKQMNEYLAVLRSLMPESYAQRGDQASIIGGAINFVKELEQQLHSLSAHREKKEKAEGPPSLPFSEFFTFPQYSSTSSNHMTENLVATNIEAMAAKANDNSAIFAADIEVTMVESHANLKIRARQQPKQLLKMVSGFREMSLTILHLYVNKVDQIVLYSLCVKVEDDCKLASVDEIATSVYQMLGRIQEEAL